MKIGWRACWALLAWAARRRSRRASAQGRRGRQLSRTSRSASIVRFAAGGGNDLFARLVGQKLGENPRPDRHHREQAGRRRADRGRVRDEPAADGYTIMVGGERRDVDRRGDLSEAVLSPDPRLHSAHDDREFPADPRRPGGPSGQDRQGPGRVGKKNPDKSNYASTSPAFTIATELFKLKSGMPADDSLQEQQRDDAEHRCRRQHPVRDRRRSADHAAGEGRQGAGARGDRIGAIRRSCPMCRAWRKRDIPRSISGCGAATSRRSNTPPAIVTKLEAELRKAIADAGRAHKLKAMAVDAGRRPGDGVPQDDRRRHQEVLPT